jgi:hypothetical protein
MFYLYFGFNVFSYATRPREFDMVYTSVAVPVSPGERFIITVAFNSKEITGPELEDDNLFAGQTLHHLCRVK